MKEDIKRRKLHVEGMTCGGCENRINSELSGLDGIKTVRADKGGTVDIKYDLMKIRLDAIEQKINDLGYRSSPGLVDRISRSWRNFTEENEYDNMHYHPV